MHGPQHDTQPVLYEIRVKGSLTHDVWSAWFDGMEIRPGANNETVLVGPVVDQAALYGILTRLRDLALPLISVRVLENNQHCTS